MLDVQHIFKTYEGRLLLNDISFQVDTGETICLLGASGSGKSTLLRIIAGLEDADSGTVSFNGIDITKLPPHLRDFGLVFQDYALFPHLRVRENVAFGLKMRRLPETEIKERVVNSLEMVNLSSFEERQVTDLSGGEQQRVALARALATRPRLLMFDEPLGALDRTLREDLLQELRKILHQTTIPAVYVTHDQEEAFAIADRVLILHDGKIVRQGSPVDVWADPQTAFVARFLGLGLVFEGRVLDGTRKVETRYGVFNIACEHPHQTGEAVHVLARPLPAEQEANTIRGVVSDVIFQQDRFKVTLENGFYVYVQRAPKVGEELAVPVRIECLS
ncbi:MAG TPA: ABC transporter ATP-binding protein [Anaerolineales bacterium]|nr:ABC transporter ATP-binding protein [Anaerolineales bacterium]